MKQKYQVGDMVIISKSLSSDGRWIPMDPKIAKVVEIKPTITFGPAYVLEAEGKRIRVCYWEDDIDECIKDEDYLWETWGDQ